MQITSGKQLVGGNKITSRSQTEPVNRQLRGKVNIQYNNSIPGGLGSPWQPLMVATGAEEHLGPHRGTRGRGGRKRVERQQGRKRERVRERKKERKKERGNVKE